MALRFEPGRLVVPLAYVAPAVLFVWTGGIVLLDYTGVKLLSDVLLRRPASGDLTMWGNFPGWPLVAQGRSDPVPAGIDGAVLANVTDQELVDWFVEHGWRESKQELVERFRRDFVVVKKHG